MKKMLIVLTSLGLVFGLLLSSFSAESAKPLIIDVRTEAEWDSGHIEGALLIPYEQIGEKIGTIARDKSKRLKETLDKLGDRDVINLGALENAAKAMKLKIVR